MAQWAGMNLCEAAVLARDTHRQLGQPKLVTLAAVYDYALKVCRNEYGSSFSISVHRVDVRPDEGRGMLCVEDHVAEIFVSKELNRCWRRFVTVKELLHLLIGPPYTKQVQQPVADQIREAYEMFWPQQAQAPMKPEQAAAIVAFELLYPWPNRHRVANPPPTVLGEATSFLIPARYVDVYFNRGYGKLSEDVNDPLQVP